MIVHVHGFDWGVYAGRVMPAFERWLTDKDETTIYQLFERTHCNLEEQFLPDPMQRLRVWPRAKTFVDALPRGPHSRREYAKICSAEQFTVLSDRYLHNHTPHLYQNAPAVRTVWGAFCRAAEASSGSAPPCAASGFVTPVSPGGRSSAVVSAPARTRPARPMPVR